MVQLSIILPATGTQRALDNTLLSVLENRPDGCEVILPHFPSYRDPYDLADEVRFVAVQESGCPLDLINAGIDDSHADIVHVIQSGIEVTAGWTTVVAEKMASDDSIAAVSPLIVDAENPGQMIAAGVCYGWGGTRHVVGVGRDVRSERWHRAQVHGPTLRAGFFRRSVLVSLGKFQRDFGEHFCDVRLASLMHAQGYTCAIVPECVVKGGKTANRIGFKMARQSERLFWRNRRYYGGIGSFVAHGLHVGMSFLINLPRPAAFTGLAGRAIGFMDSLGVKASADDNAEGDNTVVSTISFEMARQASLKDRRTPRRFAN